jgi:hypothetical protein
MLRGEVGWGGLSPCTAVCPASSPLVAASHTAQPLTLHIGA